MDHGKAADSWPSCSCILLELAAGREWLLCRLESVLKRLGRSAEVGRPFWSGRIHPLRQGRLLLVGDFEMAHLNWKIVGCVCFCLIFGEHWRGFEGWRSCTSNLFAADPTTWRKHRQMGPHQSPIFEYPMHPQTELDEFLLAKSSKQSDDRPSSQAVLDHHHISFPRMEFLCLWKSERILDAAR